MKYTTITYKRIKNLGNSESEHLEMSVQVDESEDIEKAVEQLKYTVRQNLGLIPEEVEANEKGLEDFSF